MDQQALSIVARMKAAQDKTDAALTNVESQLKVQQQFIARMISEYKAHLVKRVSGLQAFIDDERFKVDHGWGRSQLAEVMRRLELSDSELLPLINAADPKLSS